jgi:homoisocitrate dehydrogenase
MDLYANIRPITSAVGAKGTPIDMLIIRENTECLYIKSERLETDPKTGLQVAWADRKISEYASKRIARIAFNMALARHEARKNSSFSIHTQPKVTIVHKSNVLSITE